MVNKLDLRGFVVGRLRVLHAATLVDGRSSWWVCECACGSVVEKRGTALHTGRVMSCGCLVRERMQAQGTHNHCRRGAESPTWKSWKAMHDRCKPSHKSRRHYADRGVRVCQRWTVFETFLEDMGPRPPGTTLDRVHSARGYTPSNCRWASASTQQLNKRGTRRFALYGKKQTLTEWARDPRCKVAYATLHKRVIGYGFPFEKSFLTESGSW